MAAIASGLNNCALPNTSGTTDPAPAVRRSRPFDGVTPKAAQGG